MPTPTQTENLPATQAEGSTPALTPDMIAAMAGMENQQTFQRDELLIPYLTIVQNTSPYMQRSRPEFIPDARQGDLIDTLTLQLRASASFIPCVYQKHYTTWKPNMGPLVKQWFTDDSAYRAAGTDFGKRTDHEGNIIVPSAVYYGLLMLDEAGSTLPCVISMTSTQTRKANRWNSLIASLTLTHEGRSFNPPMRSRIYHLTTVPESNDRGSWAGWKIEPSIFTMAYPNVGQALMERAKEFTESVNRGEARAAEPVQATRSADEETSRPVGGNAGGGPQVNDDIPF